MRLFIAVWPSVEVGRAVADIGRPTVPGLRWTPSDQWHVTLRFCGEVPDGEVPALVDAVRTGLAGQPPVRAAVGDTTARFGRSGILHLPVLGLDDVAARVRAASAPFGDADDGRPFRAHLALARARRGLPGHVIGRPVEWADEWPVAEVAVVANTLDPAGARYRNEVTITLDG